jgi:hypothetical protein
MTSPLLIKKRGELGKPYTDCGRVVGLIRKSPIAEEKRVFYEQVAIVKLVLP